MPRPRFFSFNSLQVLSEQITALLQATGASTRSRASSVSSYLSSSCSEVQDDPWRTLTPPFRPQILIHGHEFEMATWRPENRFSAFTTTSAEDSPTSIASSTFIPRYYIQNRNSGSSTLSEIDLGTVITRARSGSTILSGVTLVENFATCHHSRRYSSALDSSILETAIPRICPLVTPYFEQRATFHQRSAAPDSISPPVVRRHSIAGPVLRFLPSTPIPGMTMVSPGTRRVLTGTNQNFDLESGVNSEQSQGSFIHWRLLRTRVSWNRRYRVFVGMFIVTFCVVIIVGITVLMTHKHLFITGIRNKAFVLPPDDNQVQVYDDGTNGSSITGGSIRSWITTTR